MRRVLVVPLMWSIVMLAGCAGNPTPHEAPTPPAPPTPPAAASPPPAPPPVVAPPPKPAETGEAIVTKIVTSAKLDEADLAASNGLFPIYAEASLMGHGRVKLTAIWQYQTGAVIGRTNTVVTLDGSAVASFKVEHPDAWPLGWYQLEIDVNDQKPNSAEHFMVTSQGLISEGFGPRSKFPHGKAHGNPH